MFLDLNDQPHLPPWEPPREQPRLTARDEKVLLWAVSLFLLLLFFSPLAGVTLFDAVLAVIRR